MTKTNTLLVVVFGTVLVLAFIGTLNKSNTAEVNTIEVEEVIEVNPNLHLLDDEDALQAAKDVIRRKDLEATKNSLEGQISALEEQLEAVDKELGVY